MCDNCRPLGAHEGIYGDDPDAFRAHMREYMRERNAKGDHEEVTYVGHSPGLGLFKLGHTRNLKNRSSGLKTGCPDATIVATYAHGRELEAHLKDTFAHVRLPGTEWFRIPHLSSIQKAVASFEEKVALDAA